MKNLGYEWISGCAGWVEVPGFLAGAAACDIRGGGDQCRLDLALLHSESPCEAAGIFTRNVVKAAPVLQCQEIIDTGGPVHGLVVNSGNANAATGIQGRRDAAAMARLAAEAVGQPEARFLVGSTGRIGRALPMESITRGIAAAAASLSSAPEQGKAAADAILTSDTRRKTAGVRFKWGDRSVTLSGIAKGAGMIQPNMATMLAYLVTDLAASPAFLKRALREAAAGTFNAITVDGDMSTNDTVLLLANGTSGVGPDEALDADDPTASDFIEALTAVCADLSRKIVGDGERISKVVEVICEGAPDPASADRVCRAIGNSLLVKTSWYGNDPNWGRVLHAAGYAGVPFDPDGVDLAYRSAEGECLWPVLRAGTPLDSNLPDWKRIVSEREFAIVLNLHAGAGSARLLATDLTEGYVNFNKSE